MVKQASYVKFYKLLSAALIIVITGQLTAGEKSSDVLGIMLPKVKQRIIEAGSDLNISCIYKKIPKSKYDRGGSQQIKWKLPDSVHHHKDLFLPDQNETHVISLIRVTDAKPSDTGTYRCNLQFYSDLAFEQYIYVFSKEEPIVFDNIDTRMLGKLGVNELVPCKPTHPDVRLILKRINLIEHDGMTERKLGPDLLTSKNSKWKVEPKRGLVLNKVTFDDMGNYSCLALNYNISIDFKIDVLGLELIRIESEKRPVEGDNITLICRSRLLTWPPEWSFSKNQSGPSMEVIDEWRLPEGIHIETSTDNFPILESRLFLTNFSINSPIFFRCSAFDNETDCMDYQQTINVLDTDSGKQLQQLNFIKIDHAIYPIVLMILLIVGISISIRLLVSKKHKVFPQGSELLKGKPIEANLPVDEQFESIPYDKRWEFPQHRLKLGIQLGVGCFGRVVKAEAVGIKRANETVKTVAVKMVRTKNNFTALEALISELKILIHLGSHLNVVNLLGACTKNITKGELLVIVEYCRFGSLQTYLNAHRSFFVNQVDQYGSLITKEEDEAVGITKRSNYYMTDGGVENQGLEIVEDVFDRKEIDENLTNTNFNTKSISSSMGNKPETPKSSTAPHWYYEEGSDVIPCNSLTTRDLMCWSFQIARGMDYLANKHVFHGDLAARNVLLADDGVVKVADFGMAHKMYYEASYQKSGQGLLPVKWMALESLTDRIFSSQSDVWSYGVLLWELFTLGKVPYPGMDASHILIKELQNGYRMEKPEYAPNLIGEIMSSCWKANSKDRPTFSQIDETICRHLESTICSYYLDLNISYLKLNDERKNSPSEENFGQANLLDSQEKHCQIIVVNQQADPPGFFKILSSSFTNKGSR